MQTYESYSEESTLDFAKKLGMSASKGEIFCLIGDLGVGKTVFSKGFAIGMGIDEHITSPTFTIVHEYEGCLPLYHFDVYRISDEYEMDEIGYEEYFYGEGVCLIEWANIIPDIIPEFAKYIIIEKDLEKGFEYRKITIKEGEDR
ncbi:MAG TPA: tRNA (adenosine(37)-N6)-threonylcarbamoyltransferase complex ATPase subunit type 1 TsaE [Epulopiscium sp.]|nr:tRNA (adenosine(37)-N6)-threonylcarbamoyltransferase complex ATPase subunit type 1 TsaE [Candidatus Epulonipiscium sp.]